MARRRFQDPKLRKHGNYWTIVIWKDEVRNGQPTRRQVRVRLAPLTMGEREARKVKAEYLTPLNQTNFHLGSATNFQTFVQRTYMPKEMPLLAKSTRDRYQGVIDNYLVPAFGKLCLREITTERLQEYFCGMQDSKLSHESQAKIRTVLASIFARAHRKYHLLASNPLDGVELLRSRMGRRKVKLFITPEQFNNLIKLIAEPYATMVYVAIYTGLRVSELAGLRWEDVHEKTITIDERFCRGDWGAPKNDASNATIGVNHCVIDRIQRLRSLTIDVQAGHSMRKYRVVKSDAPGDLVFQSVKDGKPMRDNNILSRFIKPAARMMGLPWLNWRSLRTSHCTWLKIAGADVKDAQAQMRHSRASTTLDIYQQFVPESQMRVVERLNTLRRIM